MPARMPIRMFVRNSLYMSMHLPMHVHTYVHAYDAESTFLSCHVNMINESLTTVKPSPKIELSVITWSITFPVSSSTLRSEDLRSHRTHPDMLTTPISRIPAVQTRALEKVALVPEQPLRKRLSIVLVRVQDPVSVNDFLSFRQIRTV